MKRAAAVFLIVTAMGCPEATVEPTGVDSGFSSDGGPTGPGGSDGGETQDGGGPDSGAADAGSDAGVADAGPPVDLCPAGAAQCLGYNQRRYCGATAQGRRWLEETCASGSGCVSGQCVAGSCTDECTLGETVGGKTCELHDVTSGTWVQPDPAGSTHDRARAYERWIRRHGMSHGGIASALFSDPPSYTQIEYMHGAGDSAIWTGTYLAAEALRLIATGAADARANVVRLVDTLHLWLNVSGSPGNLARFVVPSGAQLPYTIPDLNCSHERVHCGVSYGGKSYDYVGHVSRDQYQGVMLGLALAYEALTEEDARSKDLIRTDVVTLVKELMKERTVPLKITYNGTTLPTANIQARFIVVNTAEMDNGALILRVNTSNVDDSEMYGFQEFSPDLAMLIREIPGLGWVPSIPRASSAIMLASFFQVALRVTDRPEDKADHDAIYAFYTGNTGRGGNVGNWLAIAKQWSSSTNSCGGNYYANNIAMQPMYNLARLESDPGRRSTVVGEILTSKMWPVFSSTKNSFFSFIYAGVATGVDPQVTSSAAAQLSQFPAPPRVHRPVDLRADPRYQPHDSDCPDHVDHSMAVDVGDRVTGDFLWQRHPWGLYDPGDLRQTEPGVDYLTAYWLGRRHGFISDDTPGRCLALRP